MNRIRVYCLATISLLAYSSELAGQNPFITDQFTADPSARVFGDRVYVYPSHDIPCTEERGRIGWFCMEDYHVFSSSDLTGWTDHGVIVSQNNVDWVDSTSYSMWAPDCIFRNGKYYFYFPTRPQDTTSYGRGFRIGVAVADQPEGPFAPEPDPIENVRGIDPNVFLDQDGQAYLYWSAGDIFGAKLKENMLELASEPVTLGDLPQEGLKEGPFVFERNGIYYLTYPHVANKTERLEYATSNNPLGPFEVRGVIMDESPTGCWTNHHSIIEFRDQWYLFYHHNDLSPEFDKNRSVRVDSLFFNEDGTIQKTLPTLRGVGLTQASGRIQIDRYSAISDSGATIDFLDSLDRFKGWKTTLDGNNAWIRYDQVDFEHRKWESVKINARSETGGVLQLRFSVGGPVVAQVEIPKGDHLKVNEAPATIHDAEIQDLIATMVGSGRVEIDWISFE